MSGCRGVIIAGVTNTARTQMAESLLRAFTAGRVFVCSGAVHHAGVLHPLAVSVMQEAGLDVRGQSCTSLAGALRQRRTYDVYVSVDAPYAGRASDAYQRRSPAAHEASQPHPPHEDSTGCSPSVDASSMSRSLAVSAADPASGFSDPLLASATPAHWGLARDTTDARQSWTLWSPRDPTIMHETSTRKLQDHLYEGEPLFMRMRPQELRQSCRVRRRWEVAEVATRYALETEAEQRHRFTAARDHIASLALSLVRDLESEYGAVMLDEAAVAAYRAALKPSREARAVGEQPPGTGIAA